MIRSCGGLFTLAFITFVASIGWSITARGDEEREEQRSPGSPSPGVQEVLEKHRAVLPESDDLTVYRLDWVPTLDEAKEKAAREMRPLLLIVVTNSYGNLYSGHC